MLRKKTILSLLTLFLLSGAALAQNDTASDDFSDAEAECEAERQHAYADADEEYEDERADAERADDNASADGDRDDHDASAEAERDEAYADADEEYRDCIADAAEERAEERDEEERDEDEDDDSLPIPDSYEGDHIAFDVTDFGAANYTVDGVLVLSSVSADHAVEWEEYRLREPSVKLEGESSGHGSGAELKAADVESGVFVFESDGSITVVFPDGVNVTAGYHADHHEAERDDDEDDADDEDSAAECESEYQEKRADAERHRDEAIADGDNESEAREEYAEELADAEKDREECHADAREDAADEDEDEREDDDSDFLTLKGDGFQAILYTEEGYSLDGQTLTTSEEIRLVLGDPDGLSKESTKGIADGHIAAGVKVPRNGAPVTAQYDDVEVTIEATETGLIATVERDDPEGRAILFELEEGALGDLAELTVLFDGEVITQAEDMADLRETSDGAEYLILLGASGAEVLVQVPHFSPHTIELTASHVPPASIPGPSTGLIAAAVLGLTAAVQAVRRR